MFRPTSAYAQQASLEDVLITEELHRRKPRRRDHAAENRALVALTREMASNPRHILQKLVDLAVELCHAGSAGISLLERDAGGQEFFRWNAMAGKYSPHVGGRTPRDFSPCGTTLDRKEAQLFFYPARRFTYFDPVTPSIVEGLVIPFYRHGEPLGTIWIISHDERRRFDSEDVRIMTSLGELTSAAFHMLSTVDALASARLKAERTAEELELANEALREGKEALRNADRRKDEFLATLGHELRNPLAPILNSLHILRFAESLSPVQERALEIAERQSKHLIRLVDDLLEVSRITRGKLELRKERTELSAAVRNAVETSRPLIESAGHELTVMLPAEPLILDADPVRLSQIISNLLNNAAKYTDAGGRIRLAVEREGSEAVITVEDSGIGIGAEMLPRIFEIFTQGDHSSIRCHGGLGIGLALVQRLVEMHGGTVEASSAGCGQGSTFTVRLPLARVPRKS